MKTLRIVHLGLGNIGTKAMEILLDLHISIQNTYGVKIVYDTIASSKGALRKPEGLQESDIEALRQGNFTTSIQEALAQIDEPYVLVDTTASEQTVEYMHTTLTQGGYIVTSNKKPLSGSYGQFKKLRDLGGQRLFFETTVGAGLPIVQTLQSLVESGDKVIRVQGCFSGTLGYLCSELEKGTSYSQAVHKAKELGFTEPDPRDDLSGLDVARKGLILARLIGSHAELDDIEITPLYDITLADEPVSQFLSKIKKDDQHYKDMFIHALSNEQTLRYTATIEHDTAITVGLKEGQKNSPLGALNGPDNIVIFQTKRYLDNPLIIQGPGAGIDVTAAGVVHNVLQAVRYHRL